jgi:CRP-like cAMP-binding protein
MNERNPLIMKLEQGAALSDEDRQRLRALTAGGKEVGADVDIILEGEAPNAVRLVMSGLACRYKALPNGRRSIMAYLVPGDFCDLHIAILGEMDHSISTLTPCTIVEISTQTVLELLQRPMLARALWWSTLVDESILREWLVNMGQRAASQQMAHLFCELLIRLQTVGLATENSFPFLLTQAELADTLGLTPVHINRVLQQLREDGFIVLKNHYLLIKDVPNLMDYAQFTPNYLHRRNNGGVTLKIT